MRATIEIENIEEMRRQAGIVDVELRDGIRELGVGDLVKLTFLATGTTSRGETLPVRITSIKGQSFRGKLASEPASNALADLHAGSLVAFTRAQIHSLANRGS